MCFGKRMSHAALLLQYLLVWLVLHVVALSNTEGQNAAGKSCACLPGHYAPCTVHALAPYIQLFQDHVSVGLHHCSKTRCKHGATVIHAHI